MRHICIMNRVKPQGPRIFILHFETGEARPMFMKYGLPGTCSVNTAKAQDAGGMQLCAITSTGTHLLHLTRELATRGAK